MSAEIAFNAEIESRFKKLTAKYETLRSALLPTLYLAQEQFGYLSPDVMTYVAKRLDVPPAHVFEAVTFYVLFKKKDMGKFCLQVCNNITCTLMGSEKLIQVVKEELGLSLNGVSEDKMFSLVPVQCLGSCDTAPVVQVNDDYFEKLNPETFRAVLKKLKAGEYPSELAKSQGVAE